MKAPLWILAVLFVLAAPMEMPEEPPPGGYQFKVIGIVFKIENFGGKVMDLEIRETATEVRIELAADVLFDFDKADLLPRAAVTLEQAAAFIKEKKAGAVRIEGYTDAKGDDAYNQKLSERRAKSVQDWFTSNGLSEVRFSLEGFGEKNPIAPNAAPDGSDDPKGRQKNRRVEIVISKG